MNKLIIGAILVLGVFLTAGFGEEKQELNSKLFGTWYGNGNTDDVVIFKPNSSLLYLKYTYSEENSNSTYDTIKGTWSTKESEIILTYSKNKTERNIYYFLKGNTLLLFLCQYNDLSKCESFFLKSR